MPVVQLATFLVSETYQAKPEAYLEAFKAPLDIIKSAEGHISSFYGSQIEDGGKTGYFLNVWETYEHHEKLMNDPGYAKLMEAFKPAIAGNFERHYFEVNSALDKALTAPVTEIVVFPIKQGKSKDEVNSLIAALAKALDEAPRAYPPSLWGESIKSSGTILMAIGWESVEAHMDAVQADHFLNIINPLRDTTDLYFKHTSLTKYVA